MSRKNLLRVAAFFVLLVFIGHTLGALQGPPPGNPAVDATYKLMTETLVPLPMGTTQSIATLMRGANFCLSVYLLVAGLIFIALSTSRKPEGQNNQQDTYITLINSAGMILTAIVSVFFLFPVPAICTGLSGIFGFLALRAKT